MLEVGKNKVKVPKLDLSVILNEEEEEAKKFQYESNSSSLIKSSVEVCDNKSDSVEDSLPDLGNGSNTNKAVLLI